MYSAKFICVFSEDNLELLLVYIASGKIHSLHFEFKIQLWNLRSDIRNLRSSFGIILDLKFQSGILNSKCGSSDLRTLDLKLDRPHPKSVKF